MLSEVTYIESYARRWGWALGQKLVVRMAGCAGKRDAPEDYPTLGSSAPARSLVLETTRKSFA